MELCIAPDHPVIRNMERTGYPDGKEPRHPVCGKERESIYRYSNFDIVDCDVCTTFDDAWDIVECFEND